MQITHSSHGPYGRFLERANKLVTALFMVTDIMDTNEPLRIKLRHASTEMLSDMYGNSNHTPKRVSEIMSFLSIASTLGMISEMNFNILKKEFSTLLKSITDNRAISTFWSSGETALLDFLKEDEELTRTPEMHKDDSSLQGHIKPARIGVQKGSTLMKVLSDKISTMSVSNYQGHDVLKSKRRSEIIEILKGQSSASPSTFSGLTITDIKRLGERGVLATCGDKTVQRELISMVGDGVLKKTGEKRWSRYFLNPN